MARQTDRQAERQTGIQASSQTKKGIEKKKQSGKETGIQMQVKLSELRASGCPKRKTLTIKQAKTYNFFCLAVSF